MNFFYTVTFVCKYFSQFVANIFNIEIVFRDNSEIKMILRSIFLNFIFVTPMIDKDSNIIDVVLFLHDNIRFYLTQPSWIL